MKNVGLMLAAVAACGIASSQGHYCRKEEYVSWYMSTCRQCPSGTYSHHYCGISLFGLCLDDCYECWLCQDKPTSTPTRPPVTGSPTSAQPTSFPTASPSESPTPQPTSAPTLSLDTLNQTLGALEDCVDRNLMYDDMVKTWQEDEFQQGAIKLLEEEHDKFGLSLDSANACLTPNRTQLISLADYDLEDLRSREFHEHGHCLAFSMYYFVRFYYLPSIHAATGSELAAIDWRNLTQLCPLATVGLWEAVQPAGTTNASSEVVRMNAQVVAGSMLEVGNAFQAAGERVQAFDFSNTEHTLADLHPEYQPKSLSSLVFSMGLPPNFYDWLDSHGLVPPNGKARRALSGSEEEGLSQHSFSQRASASILQGLGQSLIFAHADPNAIACEKRCAPGEQLFVWSVRSYLENGAKYASTNVMGTCECRPLTASAYACPPSFAKVLAQEEPKCSENTFYDSVVDWFFSFVPNVEKIPPVDQGQEPIALESSDPNPLALTAIVASSCIVLGVAAFCCMTGVGRKRRHVDEPSEKEQERRSTASDILFAAAAAAAANARGSQRVVADDSTVPTGRRVQDTEWDEEHAAPSVVSSNQVQLL